MQHLQHFGRMIRSVGHSGPMFFNFAVRSDPHGGTDDTHGDLAVHFLFPKGFVLGHHFFFRVAQNKKRDLGLFNEFLVGCFTVRGNSQYNRVEFLEFAVYVTESLGFLGSPGGVVFGIKIDNDVFAPEILE
jgi:hypothetical protein